MVVLEYLSKISVWLIPKNLVSRTILRSSPSTLSFHFPVSRNQSSSRYCAPARLSSRHNSSTTLSTRTPRSSCERSSRSHSASGITRVSKSPKIFAPTRLALPDSDDWVTERSSERIPFKNERSLRRSTCSRRGVGRQRDVTGQ